MEFLKDLLEKYRSWRIELRLVIVTLIALAYPAMTYLEDVGALQQDLENQMSAEQTEKTKFDQAVAKSNKMPELQKNLKFVEKELQEAFKRLPSYIVVDQILATFAMMAKETGVKLVDFIPKDERNPGEGLRYREKPFQLNLEGRYEEIGNFLDRIVHMKKLIFVKTIGMTPFSSKAKDDAVEPNLSDFKRAQRKRNKIMLKVSAEIIIYRSVG